MDYLATEVNNADAQSEVENMGDLAVLCPCGIHSVANDAYRYYTVPSIILTGIRSHPPDLLLTQLRKILWPFPLQTLLLLPEFRIGRHPHVGRIGRVFFELNSVRPLWLLVVVEVALHTAVLHHGHLRHLHLLHLLSHHHLLLHRHSAKSSLTHHLRHLCILKLQTLQLAHEMHTHLRWETRRLQDVHSLLYLRLDHLQLGWHRVAKIVAELVEHLIHLVHTAVYVALHPGLHLVL